MIRRLSALIVLVAISATPAFAATLQVNGIPSFDTNLGTLNAVTVILDPNPAITSPNVVGAFDTISNHAHFVSPNPILVAGLGSFSFTTAQTTFASVGFGETTHSHSVNLLPSQKNFSGAGLNWFLNPANNVNTVSITPLGTSPQESHTHSVNFFPILPKTFFHYTPAVPEPGSMVLLGVMGLTMGLRRSSRHLSR